MIELALILCLLPLVAAVFSFVLRKSSAWLHALVATLAMLISALLALIVFFHLYHRHAMEASIHWLALNHDFMLTVGVRLNALNNLMLVIVTLVSLNVMLFSYGYLKTDERIGIYYAYLNFFAFSMLALVMSANLLQLYIFWEMVGLCSYLLVGFWFFKNEAARAARKSFVVTRLGDAGMLGGILLLALAAHSFNDSTQALLAASGNLHLSWLSQPHLLTLAMLLIFLGCVGKSAQFPLHVWLPDAMEGPTPVSALIHAATMVAAGVYLVARLYPLFQLAPGVLETIAYIGAGTALLAACIALSQRDIKRVIAYSTISQLGYMMAALGIGAYADGVFHLLTHAFFKALLFLAAGSVIHALAGTQDLFQMGGLRKKMPITFYTFLAGALALSGVVPFAGFWSKDAILSAALASRHYIVYALLLIAAFCTAVYIFRLIFLAFAGQSRQPALTEHAHEGGWEMKAPLLFLAIFATFAGFLNTPLNDDALTRYLEPGMPMSEYQNWPILSMLISTLVALLGIAVAYLAFQRWQAQGSPVPPERGRPWWIQISYRKFYLDEIYYHTIQRAGRFLSMLIDLFDRYFLQGLVRLIALLFYGIGNALRMTQDGLLQSYGTIALAALVVWFAIAVFRAGGVF
ncbi:NADH-quinone oxidoreductase subunit L [Alicyclobacillus tolerans]|uniref:NADH-quinone oxidoreductase subunit L n=1 Tax=Alicyclobacillus tolerans TaxID=90970 RepID=A0A1M6TCM6_9BACL|nr:NADH-quinone oxidoreductase subunit L [Alicyclobacillus montanus]SHK54792.1 NADH-quinone oxidoreductase subunit L [Alicyclobacillus montanus]